MADELLLARVPSDGLETNGVPTRSAVDRRERAAAIVHRVLADRLQPMGLRVSPLGAGWSSDIDAHVRAWPEREELEAAGWLDLDPLLGRLGSSGRGRWAVRDHQGAVLAAVDITERPPPDPVRAILDRCRRRGEVRVRECLELRALARSGASLPSANRAVRIAAAIESWLGGTVLGEFLDDAPHMPGPVPLRRGWWQRPIHSLRRLSGRRLPLALSGVDGAGKSSVARRLVDDLARAGVPVGKVWVRPGMNLKWIALVSRIVKRVLGQELTPGVRAVARGEGGALLSRRGVTGWIWSLLVTLAFLADTWRQHLGTRGVVVYDRGFADAIVTLEVLYSGPNLDLQRALIRRCLPRPELTAYLHIDAETAAMRKPGDTIGLCALVAQLERYETQLGRVAPLMRLDGAQPPSTNSRHILEGLLEVVSRPSGNGAGCDGRIPLAR